MITKLIDIIRKDYETVPYHNLRLILKLGLKPSIHGGICTDRNLYLFAKLREEGFLAKLHSAEINNLNIHQPIKVSIDSKSYLVDVGLGWPIMKPIPLFQDSIQKAFGVEFNAKIIDNKLFLYRINDKKETLSYSTKIQDYNQEQVLEEIENSYSDKIEYPFKRSIRFSKIIKNEFLFLKGDVLYYSKKNVLYKKTIRTYAEFENLFTNVFKFDMSQANKVVNTLKMF